MKPRNVGIELNSFEISPATFSNGVEESYSVNRVLSCLPFQVFRRQVEKGPFFNEIIFNKIHLKSQNMSKRFDIYVLVRNFFYFLSVVASW